MRINKLFYIPLILFAIAMILRLVDLSKIVYLFPSYDFSAHISHLYFLKEYGFHNVANNWYNVYGGEIVLKLYPPLFFFYSLIFYSIINNIQLAFYISLISVHVIGLIGVFILGKVLNLSIWKKLFLFFFFYANPITLPWFYINGRIPEMLAWTISFYLLALIFYYKDKKLDKKFYLLLILLLSSMLLAHPLIVLLFLFVILGFFLIRNNKDKLKIILASIFVPIITSFWLVGFIQGYSILQSYQPSYRFYEHTTEVIYSILLGLASLFVLYLNLRFKKFQKKEIMFFSPVILISFIYITGLFLLVPLLRSIEPRSYGIFLLLITSLLAFNLKLKTNKKRSNAFKISIALLLCVLALISIFRYDNLSFTLYTEKNKEILDILPKINGSFIVIGENNYDMHHVASIAAVKYNLTTPFGWGMREVQKEVKEDKINLKNSIENKECKLLNETLNKIKVKEIIAYNNKCDFLKSCNLTEKNKTENYCYLIN